MEDRALDRGPQEKGALVVGQALEPRGEQRRDRLRDRQLQQVARGDPAAVEPREALVVDEHGQQLLGEERVAVGRFRDPGLDLGREGPAAEQVGDQLPAVGVVQGLEHHRRRIELAAAPAGVVVEELRARHAQHEDRGVAREIREVADEIDERRLRPLQVVEHDARAGDAARAPRRACARPTTWPRPSRLPPRPARAPARSARRSGRP